MRGTRRALIGATAAAVAATAFAGAAPAQAQPDEPPPLALAAPGGDHATGTTALHLVDEDRADPWAPSERRELMVTLWYPTTEEGPTAPYMTEAESALFLAQIQPDAPEGLLAEVGTNSVLDAEPLRVRGGLPLVMLSPGFSFPRATLTGLAEELASRGYAVAAVGHNYEAPISFPDRTTECTTCTQPLDPEVLVPNRAADLAFTLDELTAGALDGLKLDLDRVAVGGHSIGGASAHRTLAADDRFDAGFNLDGTFFALDPGHVSDPFLIVGAQEHGQPGEDETWDEAWSRLCGWKRWITVEGSGHSTFTDLAPLAEQFGQPLQDLPGERADDLTRAHVTAFVDVHLRGEHEPILDGPSAEWPEVVFHHR